MTISRKFIWCNSLGFITLVRAHGWQPSNSKLTALLPWFFGMISIHLNFQGRTDQSFRSWFGSKTNQTAGIRTQCRVLRSAERRAFVFRVPLRGLTWDSADIQRIQRCNDTPSRKVFRISHVNWACMYCVSPGIPSAFFMDKHWAVFACRGNSPCGWMHSEHTGRIAPDLAFYFTLDQESGRRRFVELILVCDPRISLCEFKGNICLICFARSSKTWMVRSELSLMTITLDGCVSLYISCM